ncbi:MAG: hypothetical protein ACYT04_33285 [Nostoc sp.]
MGYAPLHLTYVYDLDAMFADWQKKQAESEREIVTLPPKHGLTMR